MKYFLLIAFICFAFQSKAQAFQDTLIFTPKFTNIQIFNSEGKVVNLANAKKLAFNDSISLKYFRKAQVNKVFSTIIGGAGGFLIGFNLFGVIQTGDKSSLNALLVGIGLVGISAPFEIGAIKNTKKAVHAYNNWVVSKIKYK
jgi:hypothetical protein